MRDVSLHWLPILPAWLIGVIALILLAVLGYGSWLLANKQVPGKWVKRLGALRAVMILVFALCLLQPVLSYSRSVEKKPELLVFVDASQSMGLSGGDGGTRLDQVRQALKDGPFADHLRKQFQIHWFGFDREAWAIAAGELGGLKAEGETTRFGESLTIGYFQFKKEGESQARVLWASDGNDLGTNDIVEEARRLGVAIDTLAAPGAEVGPSQDHLAIAQVQCAPRVLLGSETQFGVTVYGTSDRTWTLSVLEDGKEVATQEVAIPRGEKEKRVLISLKPMEVGVKRYQVLLTPRDGGTDKVAPYQVSVQVLDSKQEVLILEDTWRWEFKFLRRVFEDDPSFSFTAFLSRGGGAFVHFGEAERKVKLAGIPQSKAELDWFDTIIVGDVDPRRWPKGLTSGLAQCVREDGRSLVVVAGPNLSQLAANGELNSLLPVEIAREAGKPVEGPVDVRVTQEGAQSSFFLLPGGKSGSGNLPPLDQIYPPLRKRPAATVLLESAKIANNYGPLIVMSEHTVGRGRVLFVGTDTLWKWQTLGQGGEGKATPYAHFWQQALRALAPTRPSSGQISLWLQPDRSRYEAGQRVRLQAQIQTGENLSQPRIQAGVIGPEDKRIPLAFEVDPKNPRVYQAEFATTQPGPYRIQATLISEGKPTAEVATAIDVAEGRDELAETQVNGANLARIASATGGKVIDPADAKTWPGSEDGGAVTVKETRTLNMWSNFSLLLLLCALMGLDWTLRLLRGYV